RGRSRRPFQSGDVRDRDLPPAGGQQSTAGSIRQSARDVPAGAGPGRRGAFDRVLLSLAPRGAPPAMAAALALRSVARMERSAIHPGYVATRLRVYVVRAAVFPSCSVNQSPSRTMVMLR